MKRIFIDASLCDGCKNCTVACMDAHREDAPMAGMDSVYSVDLSDPHNESRNRILSDGKGNYFPLFCRHCDVPGCAGTCMSGALTKNALTGLVEYDKTKCAACYMCVMNCRYGIPKPDASRTLMIKCDFCASKGGEPSCVAACPKQAITVKEV